MTNLTESTLALFTDLVEDADNWSGTPLFQGGKRERGNLTDLKKHGLVITQTEDGCTWVFFTEAGKAFAAEQHIEGAQYL